MNSEDFVHYHLSLTRFTDIFRLRRADGYTTRFGVTYVDFATMTRYPKASAWFLKEVSIFEYSNTGSVEPDDNISP